MKTVTVLDFTTGEVHVYKYPEHTEDIDIFISEQGHSLDNCQWMCTNELILQIHGPE